MYTKKKYYTSCRHVCIIGKGKLSKQKKNQAKKCTRIFVNRKIIYIKKKMKKVENFLYGIHIITKNIMFGSDVIHAEHDSHHLQKLYIYTISVQCFLKAFSLTQYKSKCRSNLLLYIVYAIAENDR